VTRLLAPLFAGLVLSLVPLACGFDNRTDSGTSTNWYRQCDENAPCGSDLACICGRCTRVCDETTDCGEGVCASRLASVVQCGGEEVGLICIQPEPDSCNVLPLTTDDELQSTQTVDCNPGALICEDFEGPFPSEYSTWLSSLSEEPAGALQDCDVLSGQGALQVESANDDWWQTRVELPAPLESGEVHARLYAKVSSADVLPSYLIFFELWNSPEVTDEKISVELSAEQGLRLTLGTNGTLHESEPESFPLDQWVCVELALNLDSMGSARLSIDGAAQIDEAGINTLPLETPFFIVTFGGVPSEEVTGFEILLDDLVVATEPIGCL